MSKPQKTTLLTKEAADEHRGWYVVDLEGQVLGRAATTIASVLRGKHKPTYTPHVDSGDFVVVVNADKVKLTGAKVQDKLYYRHSLYPGGFRATPAGEMLDTHPERLIRAAVWGMLPKTRLGRKMIKKLKIYSGAVHEHAAQKPQPLSL
jgi:large subunit ribosomal protein L13